MKLSSPPVKLLFFIFILLFGVNLHAASKSDLDKEKRWRAQIEPSLMVGEALELKAGDTPFLALFTESSAEQTYGGVILMHGIGVHPAWPDVIEPLRVGLAEQGWHTLSIQMPILANDANSEQYAPLFDEVPARIQAAIDFYKEKKIKNIVLIGHSLGTVMATHYFASQKSADIRAYIAISPVPGIASIKAMDSLSNLAAVKVPMLDIFGSDDFKESRLTADKRKMIAKKSANKGYQQVKIEGANHFFAGMDDILLQRVHGWLKKNANSR